MAYVAYHFHWTREEILNLHHRERHRWVEEISRINQKINDAAGAPLPQAAPAAPQRPLPIPTGMGGFTLVAPEDDED